MRVSMLLVRMVGAALLACASAAAQGQYCQRDVTKPWQRGCDYPTYQQPSVYAQPGPVYVQPVPVYAQPVPVYAQPIPVYPQPYPAYAQPQHAWTGAPPAPVPVPVPVYAPQPVYADPVAPFFALLFGTVLMHNAVRGFGPVPRIGPRR